MSDKDLDKSKQSSDLSRKQKEIIEKIRKRSEAVVGEASFKVLFRCSKFKRDFALCLKKGKNELYKIEGVIHEGDLALSSQDLPFLIQAKEKLSKENEIEIDKIKNREELKCPYCGAENIIKCSCGKLGCNGGLIEKNEKPFYKCPWCADSNYVSEEFFYTVKGEKFKGGKFLEERKKELPGKGETNGRLLSGE